MEQNKK